MNFRQLIFRNLWGNLRTYAAYFISSLIAAFIFYIFSMLLFHPQLKENFAANETMAGFAKMGLNTSLVVIAFLSLFFLWYTFVIFLKKRKHDFAIYSILGIDSRDLRKLIFFENTLLGTIAAVCGISLGILFTKIILLLAQNVMNLTNPLRFQVSEKAVLLTLVIYVSIFLIISLVAPRTIESEEISSLIKENKKPRPEPASRWYLALLGIACLVAGYSMVLYFSWGNSSFTLLLFGVLLTVLGTIILLSQGSVFLLKRLKKYPRSLRKVNLLTLSEMIFRMKDNALMYSMIAISTSVAFVGIAVMMAVGTRSFADIQGPAFAYTFYGLNESVLSSESYQKNRIAQVEETIADAGYQPVHAIVPVSSVSLRSIKNTNVKDELFYSNYLSIIPESAYRKMLAQIQEPAEALQENEILVLSNSYNQRKKVLAADLSVRTQDYETEFGKITKDMQVTYSPTMLGLDLFATSVVTDDFFQELIGEQSQDERNYFAWIDYPEWDQNPSLDHEVMRDVDEKFRENQEKSQKIFDELGEQTETMDLKELIAANPYIEGLFYVTSKYTIFQETRQGNGLILMITVLLGTVFFSFSASILYFRLFSDLKEEGAYHRSLHVLGVSKKERHTVVSSQMLVMYFLPTTIAMLHFAVAMVSLKMLVELPVWTFYGKIILIYLIFQTMFFFICKKQYQKHLDDVADPMDDK